MKECPVCACESLDEVDACKHCGTAFFFQPECLQPRIDDPADDLVIVGRYANEAHANMVKGLLEANDIDACIPEEITPSALGCIGIAPIQILTVRVARRDVEAAQRVITESNIA